MLRKNNILNVFNILLSFIDAEVICINLKATDFLDANPTSDHF